MGNDNPFDHPVLQAYVDDVDRPVSLVARWVSNRDGDHVATRERPINGTEELEELLGAAGGIDGPSAEFLRAFVAYRGALAAAQARLRTTPVWLDGDPYELVDTREAKGRLVVSKTDWERAPGEAAIFLADWAPAGDCPVEATDLWTSGLRHPLWTSRRFDPHGRLVQRVERSIIRLGDADHPFRPDLAAVSLSGDTGEAVGVLLERPYGDEWSDARYCECPSFREAVYLVANHGGDVRRDPLPGPLVELDEAPSHVRGIVVQALDPSADTETLLTGEANK